MIIEFLPDYTSWADWNGNLVHYFAEQQFPIVQEDQWRDVATAIEANPTFGQYAIPNNGTFTDWKDWARALIVSVNGA